MSGTKVNCKSFLIITSIAVIFLLTTGLTGYADLSGSWKNDLYLNPGPTMIGTFDSQLSLRYSSSGIDYTSLSLFRKDSYYAQTFKAHTNLGLVDVDSSLDFDPQKSRLNYFRGEADLTLANLNIGNTLLLENTKSSGYGAGYQLELSGRIPKGPGIYVNNLMGMEENQAESLGIVRGSGYTIKQGSAGPSSLQYVSTTIEITYQRPDCCSYTSTTRFSKEEGFEHSILEFDLETETLPFELGAKLKFTSQTKSVELNPMIDMNWACFEIYTDLTTADDEDLLVNNSTGVSTLAGLEIEGFGITNLNLGHVTVSSITALKGNLNRLTNQEDIDLRAEDYVLDPDPVYSSLYTNTPYDEVISVEKSGKNDDLYFGADIYFDMSGSISPFDMGLVTGVGSYDLSDQFTLGVGVAIKPDKLDTVRFNFDYYF